ncbi:hypothetical protein B0H21DRAFT_824935 [Amylocystis lapponica]|nr:hypothetical protein B0H21DRAFT_824935 [Amylocystis lapponica]
MRCCAVPTARILTLISLALISARSFHVANAQSSPALSDIGLSPPPSSPSVDTPSSTPAPTVTPTDSTGGSSSFSAPSSPTDSSQTPSQPPSDSAFPTGSSISSSSSAFSPAFSSSSSSYVAPSSSSFSSSSSSSFSSSSSSSVSLSSSSSAPTSSSTPATVVLSPSTGVSSVHQPSPTGYTAIPTGSGISNLSAAGEAPSSTSSATSSGASSKGFFSHTGAVAGVFTVVGLALIGTFVGTISYCKRRQRLQDDEDAAYFEKEPDFVHQNESFSGPDTPSITDLTMPATAGDYPDRATHYGDMPAEDPTYGMNYPRGTAYAAAAAGGGQYQYTGQSTGYGEQYSAYYSSSTSPQHPYANPSNSYNPGGAPPVQGLHSERSLSHYEDGPEMYQVEAE